MTRSVLFLALAALGGCATADPTRSALQQTIVPLCGAGHSVSVASGPAVTQVRSECKPASKPQ